MKLGLKRRIAPLLVAAVSLSAAIVYGTVDDRGGKKAVQRDEQDRTLSLVSSLDES